MERADAEQKIRLNRMTHEEQLRQRQIEHEAQLRQKQADQESELRSLRTREDLTRDARATAYKQRIEYLQSIRGLEVDITQFLTARHNRPDRLIRIDGGGRPQLHLHGRQ